MRRVVKPVPVSACKNPLPERPPGLNAVLRLVAQLGGFLTPARATAKTRSQDHLAGPATHH